MEAKEFGKENNRTILLIPGNMMSLRQFDAVIPLLEKDYHVIAISTDGYDGNNTTFTTAQSSAESVEKYLKENFDGDIELVFGESFGSATAAMLFYRQKTKINSMILSGPQYMSIGIFNGILKSMIPKSQYRLIGNLRKAEHGEKMPLMFKLYTRTKSSSMSDQFRGMAENISFETLQNCVDEGLRLYDTIGSFPAVPTAKVAVWHGAKEPNMKKALRLLKGIYPALEDHPFEGFGHGEIMLHPDIMAHDIKQFIGE